MAEKYAAVIAATWLSVCSPSAVICPAVGLVMRNYPGTLLDETYEAVVARHIQYGGQRGVPWGISESAYNARDKELTYQYSNFGVPGLGFKRGLSENLVIAPYATALATMVDPGAAAANLNERATRAALEYTYLQQRLMD